jgi:PHD/YefM family antitoxin component YafN of YafNO toxin-antitoxin module
MLFTGFVALKYPTRTTKLDIMGLWRTGAAKQRFSEVIRQSEREPQQIFRRDRLVAAVISAEEFEQYQRWRESRQRRTLREAVDEVREICARYDYELDPGERIDRDAWPDDQ